MQAIETTITVLPDGSIQIPPRPDLPPGEHRAVLVIEAAPLRVRTPKPPLQLKMLDIPSWSTDARFSREDLYDDE